MSDLAELLGGGFDTHSVEPQSDFEVLPPGKYPVIIEKAEVKQTKAKTGHYLELTLTVLDGPAKNRKVWDRINVQNPNAQCVEIGLRSLAALGQAVGLAAIGNTDQLLNLTCTAHVKVKDGSNEVRTYSAIGAPDTPGAPQLPTGVHPAQPQPQSPQPQTQPPTQPAPAAAGGKPPWAR